MPQVQLCLWNYDDPCNIFPTLRFDVAVDSFFLARPPAHACAQMHTHTCMRAKEDTDTPLEHARGRGRERERGAKSEE